MESQYREQRIKQITTELEGRETDDLLNIWKENDRQEWSAEAFDAIGQILSQRLGSLPPQEDPDTSSSEEDEEEADTYYSFERLTKIASYAQLLSRLFLAGAGGLVLARFSSELVGVKNIDLGNLVLAFINYFYILLAGGFSFVMLQALAEGIYILMDIESNTRPAKKDG